jgi:hypothetical protein
VRFKPGDIVKFPGVVGGDRGLCLVLGVEPLTTVGCRLYIMTSKHRFIQIDVYAGSILSAAIQRVNDD